MDHLGQVLMTDQTEVTAAREAILKAARRAFQGGLHPIPTPSVLSAATRLLSDLWAAAAGREVLPEDLDTISGELAPIVLAGQIQAFNRQQATGGDVDPVELLTEVVRVLGEQLGQAPVIIDGPTAWSTTCGYVVIGRLPTTPAWGPHGDAPLAVSLLREDWGGETLRPWEWSLFPDVRGGTSDNATVITPRPSIGAAGEVAQVVARVLTGDLRAWA